MYSYIWDSVQNTICHLFKTQGVFFLNNPEVETKRSTAQSALNLKTETESMRETPLGLCIRVIVNEKPLSLEKTTSSFLSVSLINLRIYLLQSLSSAASIQSQFPSQIRDPSTHLPSPQRNCPTRQPGEPEPNIQE